MVRGKWRICRLVLQVICARRRMSARQNRVKTMPNVRHCQAAATPVCVPTGLKDRHVNGTLMSVRLAAMTSV